MKFSSIRAQKSQLKVAIAALDFDSMSGADSSELVTVLSDLKTVVEAALSRAVDRSVATNRQSVSSLANSLGISEKEARSNLARQKKLNALPDVQDALAKGDISLSKASAIADGADGSCAKAIDLLYVARNSNVEAVVRRAQELNSADNIAEKRRQLRNSQFVTLSKNANTLVTGQFALLPELATQLMEAYNQSRGRSSWERAEDFAKRLSGVGTKTTQVVFHVDIQDDVVKPVAELRGIGPVPSAVALDALGEASLAMVGTINNKLAWFAEQDLRKKSGALPEFIKRAIKRFGYDRCAQIGCDGVAEQIDHITARTNGGINNPQNLQPLCEGCHHAKTKQDAPWTVSAIYDTG